MTSMGVTTATASVMPAASPAERSDQNERNERGRAIIPKKVAWPLTTPVALLASFCLYHS